MSSTSIDKLIQSLVDHRPKLQHLNTDIPIFDYLKPALTWEQQKHIFPHTETLHQLLVTHIEQLYGKERAAEANIELRKSWVVETGAHLHIPRRFNKATPTQEPQINSVIFQGQILWGVANASLGRKLAVSLNSGRVPLDNTNSGAYLDLPSLKSPLTLASKRQHPDSPQSLISARTNDDIKEKIALLDMYKKQKLLPENEYDLGRQVLENFLHVQSSFSDQVATSHALMLNKILPIHQITLDAGSIGRDFILALLKDTTSLTYSIFNDPSKRKDFLEYLHGIRTGWTEDGSPFYAISQREKGVRLLPYTGDLNPATIIKGLEEGTLWHTGVMKFFVFMVEGGMLPIGGWTQAGYCSEIKMQSEKLLQKWGFEERANALKNMPTHLIVVGPCWAITTANGKTQLLDPLTPILDPSSVDLSKIHDLTAKQTLLLAAPTLYEFILH